MNVSHRVVGFVRRGVKISSPEVGKIGHKQRFYAQRFPMQLVVFLGLARICM
jgi:hypothetical protein